MSVETSLTFFDCFAGVGGFRIPFEILGFKCVGFCEIDKHATKLYKAYHNTENEVYYNDATTIIPESMPDFDIFVGGFPCQSFSIAGKRQGFNDIRGTLFFDIARICKVKQPKYVVLENVKGLLNHDNGRTFATILGVLSDIGYSVEWALLNSKHFGVPQNRERVFIVGRLGKTSPGEIFPLGRNAEQNSCADKKETLVYWKNSKEKWVQEEKSYVPTIKTQSDICRQTLLRVGTLRTHKDGNGFREISDGSCPTIPARAREDGSGQPVVAIPLIYDDYNQRISKDQKAIGTITRNIGSPSSRNGYKIAIPVLTPDRVEKRQNGRRFKENQEPMFTLTAQDRHGVLVAKTHAMTGLNGGGGGVLLYDKATDPVGVLQVARFSRFNRKKSLRDWNVRRPTLQNCG